MTGQNSRVPQVMRPRGVAGRIVYAMMNKGHKPIYENVARVLDPQPNDELLEVACGNGYFLERYASQVHSVAGLDLSELGIRLASKRHADRIAEGTGDFVHGAAAELPWAEDRFTAVVSMGGFSGFSRAEDSLGEIHRVLRPGGRAVVSIEYNAEDGRDHTRESLKYGFRIWTEQEVRTLFQAAGFSECGISYAKAMGMPKMMLVRALK